MKNPLFQTLAWTLSIATVLAANPSATDAAPLIELSVGKTAYQGKQYAGNDSICWLVDKGGQLNRIELRRVTSFREVASSFRGYSREEMKRQLRKEFGKDYETVTSDRYIVCGPSGKCQKYLDLFDSVSWSFRHYYKSRNLDIKEPEFPIVAIVLPGRKEFDEYCKKEGIGASAGFAGFYLPKSNRTIMYEDNTAAEWKKTQIERSPFGNGLEIFESPQDALAWLSSGRDDDRNSLLPAAEFGTVEGELKYTIVHEATHQLAFNCGLHNRVGDNPKWIVEGLATMFEPEGIRDHSGGTVASRLHRYQLQMFRDYAAVRRQRKSLENFVKSEEAFQKNVRDFDAEALALTFFLNETRPQAYRKFIDKVGNSDPLSQYTREDRLSDFQQAFGKDLDRLDSQFLEYMKEMLKL